MYIKIKFYDIMELFRAGDVNRPTMFLALASVTAACNRHHTCQPDSYKLNDRVIPTGDIRAR